MATACIAQVTFQFEPKDKPLVVAFDTPDASSDGGLILLKGIDTHLCQRLPHIEPPGSGKLSHSGSPIMSQAGSPILSHPGSAIGSHPVGRDRIPSSFWPSPGILTGAHQLQEVTSGGTEESGDRHP